MFDFGRVVMMINSNLIKNRNKLASYLAKKLLASHSTDTIGYYLYLFMQTQFLACTGETCSLANVQYLIPSYFG